MGHTFNKDRKKLQKKVMVWKQTFSKIDFLFQIYINERTKFHSRQNLNDIDVLTPKNVSELMNQKQIELISKPKFGIEIYFLLKIIKLAIWFSFLHICHHCSQNGVLKGNKHQLKSPTDKLAFPWQNVVFSRLYAHEY